MAARKDVIESRLSRAEEDLKTHVAKMEAFQVKYHAGHQDVLLALAAMPTKEDFKQFSKDLQTCVGDEKKRIDDLYKRDTIGSVIVAVLASIGIVIGATK
jgi:hypothetical protein